MTTVFLQVSEQDWHALNEALVFAHNATVLMANNRSESSDIRDDLKREAEEIRTLMENLGEQAVSQLPQSTVKRDS